MLVIKWLLHVNSCAHGAARDRANGRKRAIRQSRAPRGGMSVYGSFNQARSVCFNARGCDGCSSARHCRAWHILLAAWGFGMRAVCAAHTQRLEMYHRTDFCDRTCVDMQLAGAIALCKNMRSAIISIRSLRECEQSCCTRLTKFDFKLQ